MSDAAEIERLRREAAELRDLVRELSAALARAAAVLPPDIALALAEGREAGLDPPLGLEGWRETIETTRADVAAEMELLWRRLPPRESS